jgi:hypothetical protein
MRIRTLTVNTAVFAGISVVLAAPVQANYFEGKYDVTSSDHSVSTWSVTPCGSGCVHIVSSTGFINEDAHFQNGKWVWNSRNPEGIKCGDGTAFPANESYSVDPITLNGTIHGVSVGPACGLPSMEADQTISLLQIARTP